jgi:RNA polymerase sigma factor (sigma-70 family)
MKGSRMRDYKDVKGLMFSIANRIKLNKEEAEDLVNDAWAAGNLHKCKESELSKTITNDMLMARRRSFGKKGQPKYEANKGMKDIKDVISQGDHDFSCEDKGLLELENKELVNKLLKSLDATGQTVISFRICKDKTFSEIGEELGISKQAAKRIFDKAMAKLRDSKLIKDLGQVR